MVGKLGGGGEGGGVDRWWVVGRVWFVRSSLDN